MFTFFVLLLLLILWISSNNKLKKLQAEVDALKEGLLSAEVAIRGNQQTLRKTNHSIESSVSPDILSTTEHIDEDTLSYSDLEPTTPPLAASTQTIATADRPNENLAMHVETDIETNVSEHTLTSSTSKTEEQSSLLIAQNDQSKDFTASSKRNLTDTHTDTTRLIDDDLLHSPPVLLAEPDEKSISIVTSTANSFKNWFMGGNLVVRVGAIVLLMGVVLLLRLISEYIEIPIEMKLGAIGFAGLAVAALGIKLFKKRASYGMTLQGSGLATAYLTAFFAYDVYHVLPSLPSFIILAVLSASTVALAVRQNAFPLALLAFSGAFIAPLLTNTEEGSLTTLFSYYLILNIAIAVIAHYRTWKVLNALGATVTFGFAYYLGYLAPNSFENNNDILSQRWSLVTLVILQWLLYVFIVVRYAQQISAYNLSVSKPLIATNSVDTSNVNTDSVDTSNVDTKQTAIDEIFPIDIGLMFSVPLLVIGLFFGLLDDINNGLTTASAMMALVYLVLGFFFIRANIDKRHDLIIEGMLALGFGFTALTIALAFDAQWAAIGWTIQGLALVWFGRRSLRAWLVLFGLSLQALAILSLLDGMGFDLMPVQASYWAISVTALCWMASMFVVRSAYSPLHSDSGHDTNLLPSVNNNSTVFKLVWHSPILIHLLTLIGLFWTLLVTALNLNNWFNLSKLDVSLFIAAALLSNLIIYYLIDRYRTWSEIRLFNHGLLSLFYIALLFILPEHYISYHASVSIFWPIYALLVIGGLTIGQLWIKNWFEDDQTVMTNKADRKYKTNIEILEHERDDDSRITEHKTPEHKTSHNFGNLQPTFWLATSIFLIGQFAHYLTPDSGGVLGIIAPSICLIGLAYWVARSKIMLPSWFNWETALLGSSYFFVPIAIVWVVISNLENDGVVWGLPYIPLLNLYDISVLLVLLYLLSTHWLRRSLGQSSKKTVLLKTLGLLGFWVLSSILVRTLHTYAGTSLWSDGAWNSDKVQTGLTILWTLTALIATFMSSRNGKRFWWFMGIGLLGLVVVKLVLVDLSQTEAIWRVISFLGAGSLILLIGYLAPLPPEEDEKKGLDTEIKKDVIPDVIPTENDVP